MSWAISRFALITKDSVCSIYPGMAQGGLGGMIPTGVAFASYYATLSTHRVGVVVGSGDGICRILTLAVSSCAIDFLF